MQKMQTTCARVLSRKLKPMLRQTGFRARTEEKRDKPYLFFYCFFVYELWGWWFLERDWKFTMHSNMLRDGGLQRSRGAGQVCYKDAEVA